MSVDIYRVNDRDGQPIKMVVVYGPSPTDAVIIDPEAKNVFDRVEEAIRTAERLTEEKNA